MFCGDFLGAAHLGLELHEGGAPLAPNRICLAAFHGENALAAECSEAHGGGPLRAGGEDVLVPGPEACPGHPSPDRLASECVLNRTRAPDGSSVLCVCYADNLSCSDQQARREHSTSTTRSQLIVPSFSGQLENESDDGNGQVLKIRSGRCIC